MRIARNHPLPDGNKRLAWQSLTLFLCRRSAGGPTDSMLARQIPAPPEALAPVVDDSVASIVMAPVKREYRPGEAMALVAGVGPPTDDDVSITNDGRRLDSAEAVTAFFEDLREQRAGSGA